MSLQIDSWQRFYKSRDETVRLRYYVKMPSYYAVRARGTIGITVVNRTPRNSMARESASASVSPLSEMDETTTKSRRRRSLGAPRSMRGRGGGEGEGASSQRTASSSRENRIKLLTERLVQSRNSHKFRQTIARCEVVSQVIMQHISFACSVQKKNLFLLFVAIIYNKWICIIFIICIWYLIYTYMYTLILYVHRIIIERIFLFQFWCKRQFINYLWRYM